jgi:histidine kinase-like protein
MKNGDGSGPLSLKIPADASQIATVRLFAAAVGHHYGLSDEDVEDLKLALSELCAEAIEVGDPVEVVLDWVEGSLDVEVRNASSARSRERTPDRDRRRQLIEALLSGARFEREGEERVVRFRLMQIAP